MIELNTKQRQELEIGNHVSVKFGNGKIEFNPDGYIAGLEIDYTGVARFSFKNLNGNCLIRHKQGKIIIVNLTGKNIEGTAIHYKGNFKIGRIIAANKLGKKMGVGLSFSNSKNYPEFMGRPEDIEEIPEDMNKGFYFGKFRRNKALKNKQRKTPKKSRSASGQAQTSTTTLGDKT